MIRVTRVVCTRGRSPPWLWCPYCYENAKGRANHRGHIKHQRPISNRHPLMEFSMKRRQAAAPKKNAPPVCCDTAFAERYPSLAAHLTDLWWEGGTAREPGNLTIRMSATEVFMSLSEPDDKSSAYTTAGTLEEGLELLEGALASGTVKFKGWKKR